MDIKCSNCGAEIQVEDALATAECPFCGSASIIERPSAEVERPDYAIGFALERGPAAERMRQWIHSSRNFLHIRMDFVEQAIEKEMRGIYLPAYMLGGVADIDYDARIGEDYQETETYTDSEGKTQTRTVTKTEWCRLRGNVREYLPDVLVTGSRGVDNDTLERIEPYDYALLRRFDPRLTVGWISEIPTRPREEVIQLAKEEAQAKLQARVKAMMPGDHVGQVDLETAFSDVSLNLLQVPVWSLRVSRGEGKPPIHILLNGQTGKCGGKIPYSGWRIALFILVIVGLVVGGLWGVGI